MDVTGVVLSCVIALAGAVSAVEPVVVERGPHHNVLQFVETEAIEGQSISTTNLVTQLGSGLNFFDPNQNIWRPSSGEIELLENGAIYRQGQFKLIFASDIANPNGNLEWYPTPDQHIVVQTIGLAITEDATGDSLWLGLVKSTQGFLTDSSTVTYPDCFDQVKADVRISVNPLGSGYQADVIVREKIINPFEGPAHIEVWTQVISGPEPQLEVGSVRRSAEQSDIDTQLKFGNMSIGVGHAFLIGADRKEPKTSVGQPVRVAKEYFIDANSNARYLVESLPIALAAPAMVELPEPEHARKLDAKDKQRLRASRSADGKRRRPVALVEPKPSQPKKVAAIQRKEIKERLGFLMDYTSLVNQTNQIFAGNVTYLVTTNTIVNLSGTTVIEPNCVIKMGHYNPTNNTPIINILGTLDCQTRPYAPCVITSREDRTAGETNTALLASIATNAYGYFHLCFPASNPNAIQLHDIHSRYALNAFGFLGTNTVEAWNLQITGAQGDVFEGAGNNITLRNVLVNNANNVVVPTANNTVVAGEHFTIHTASKTFSAGSFTGSSLNLTNSLVVVVTNSSSAGFTNTSGHILSGDAGVFQTVGSGYHYLADNSPYRNSGSTSISTNLTQGIFKYSTTYPPIVLDSTFAVNTTLAPQAQRDLDQPDEGFHYAALDWAVGGVAVTNSVILTLTNGVALACYGVNGLNLYSSSKIVSEGQPLNLNRIVRFNTVQEQPADWGTNGATIKMLNNVAAVSQMSLRLTEFSSLAYSSNSTRAYLAIPTSSLPTTDFVMRDCELYSCYLVVPAGSASSVTVGITNNLFHRSVAEISIPSGQSATMYFKNNLFRYALFQLYLQGSGTWSVTDNLFDHAYTSVPYSAPANSYNGYIATTALSGATHTTNVTSGDYVGGVQGNWYYPTSGGNLSLLINAGSQTAANASLYHYTTQADHTKDSGTVDMGYHYVALGSDGLPADGDGDGIPDYLEDRNGNGTADTGETNWQVSNQAGAGAAVLIVFTPLQ